MSKKPLKRIISCLLMLCMLLSLSPVTLAQYYSGESTDSTEDESVVSTQEELCTSLEELEEEAAESGTEYDGYIFKLSEGSEIPMSALEDDDSSVSSVPFSEELYTADSTEDIFEKIDASEVEYIEPNYIVELFDVETMSAVEPNDQYYQDGSQWNLDVLNVPDAWEYGLEGQSVSDEKSVVIAVIDSGINHTHQDIDESHILAGYSYVTTDTTDTSDSLGHGTFCSAQIFAKKDNGVGIAGIVPEVYIMPLRVFGSSNQAYTSDIVSAINYATASGEVDVISMSLGGEGSSTSMESACKAAVEAGILVVAAAGNDGNYTINYPASYDCVIGVGSTGTDSSHTEISDFSQRGVTNVFCVAPGYKITSAFYTSDTAYYRGSGTSFACPEVAALGAIVKSIDRSINQTQFMQTLIDTSTDLGDTGRDKIYGYGLVNFKEVIDSLIGTSGGNSGVTVSVVDEDGNAVENAEVSITKYGETSVIEPNEDGSYTLEKGKYSYTVTADKYQTATGVFSVITDSRIVKVILEGLTYPVTITPKNTSEVVIDKAAISVKNAKGALMQSESDGSYLLKNGTYTYSISATGYYTQTGSFEVNEGSVEVDVTVYGDIDVASAALHIVNADGEEISGVTVTIKNAEGGTVEPYTDGYYKLYPGTYEYIAESNSYLTETESFEVTDAQKGTIITIEIPMLNPIVWVYFEVIPLDASVSVWNSDGELVEAESAGEYKLLKGDYTYEITADGYETLRDSFSVTTKGFTIDIELTNKEDAGSATVAFVSNGGSSVTAQRVTLGEKLAEPEEPVKNGYTFAGWYKETSLTTPWNFETDVVISSISLYAKWVPKTYKIIYMYGETQLEGLEPSTHTYGSAVKELPVPVIEGQKFMYWCSDSALNNKATMISPAKASDAVLYAYCVPDTGEYEITFDSNGGSDVPSATVNADTDYLITAPETPEKTGYTFAGWYSDSTLKNAWDFETDKVDWHMTLYAAWTANTYTITYMDGEKELTDLEPVSYTYDEPVYDLPVLSDETRVFSGWYSDADCTVRVRNIPAGSIGNLVLHALWTEKRNSVPEDCDYLPDEDGNYPTVDSEGYTLIYTQEQLSALRDYTVDSATARSMKSSGSIPKFRLAQSILLTGEWVPIGSGSSYFCGIFDGAGHTIAGLYTNSSSSYQALFGSTYASEISNLYLYGQVTGGGYSAGVAGQCYDTVITDCIVDVTVTGNGSYVGGIVASLSGGSIINCANLGNITCAGTLSTATVYGTGGILGGAAAFSSSAITVSGCYNSGNIINSRGTPTGGIVGYFYNSSSTLENSYNTGDVTATATGQYATYANASGIIGYAQGGGSISNCYTTGKLTSEKLTAGIGAYKSAPTVTACYYLKGTAENGGCYYDGYYFYEKDLGSTFDYSATYDYSTLITNLGSAFTADTNAAKNGGYPILLWQGGTDASVSFTVTDAITGSEVTGASITLDGESFTDTSAALSLGFHKYTVSKPGYQTVDAIFYLGRSGASISVALTPVYYTYTVSLTPADAALTLKNDVFGTIAPTDIRTDGDSCVYTFSLARSSIYGSYTYSATKYGYGKLEGDFSVTQKGTFALTMTESEFQVVNFEVIPTTAVITVTDSDGTVIAPYEGTLYHLVEGTFNYTIKAKGYNTVTGTVTIPGTTTTISVVMEVNTGWDGSSDTDWYSEGSDTYYISNAEELAGFRDLCNAGNNFSGKTIILTNDIKLGDKAWTPVGIYSYDGSTAFKGTFDGDGHSISGLNVSGSQRMGFFAAIYGGTVKNLTIGGKVSGSNYVGGFVGQATDAAFEYCTSNVDITATGYQVGGIVGIASVKASTFTCCINNGSISTTTSYTGTNSYAVGGIVGCASTGNTIITKCRNNGDITAATQSVGGIVGAVCISSGSAAPQVEGCFNTGTITNNYESCYAGGIIGTLYGSYNSGRVLRCLNIGSIVAPDTASSGGILGCRNANYSNIGNCFYYYTTADLGIGGVADVEDQAMPFGNETDNEYAATVAKLSDYFAMKGSDIILKWEDTSSTYTVQLNVSYDTSVNRLSSDKPVYTLRNDNEEFVVPSTGKLSLTSGTYYYTAGQNGYEAATGSFKVTNGDVTVTIPLTATHFDTVFTVSPANASFTLKNSNGVEQTPVSSENGVIHYSLYNGTYTYTAECYGYETASDSVVVRYASSSNAVDLAHLDSYTVNFKLSPESGEFTADPTLNIYQNHTLISSLSGTQCSATLSAGTYTYVVRATGFSTGTGEFTVSADGTTIEITVPVSGGASYADTTWYYEDASATSYNITNAEELFGFASIVNDGIDDFSGKVINLTDNINLSEAAWTPVGSWNGTHFKGEFNGNGHSIIIYNGTISGNEIAFGLFGYLEEASVHDLIMRGSIAIEHSSESTSAVIVYAGSLAGYASKSTISRISSQLNVTVNASVGSSGILDVGGLVGWISGGTLDSSCNIGSVTATISTLGIGSNNNCLSYGGGLVGYGVSMGNAPLTISNCYSTGAVKCTGPSIVSAAGIIGVINSGDQSFIMQNCYSTGSITADSPTPTAAALTASASISGTTVNNYYLEGSADSKIGYSKTDEEMKSQTVAEALGTAYSYVEGRYPKLAWEKTAGTISVVTMPTKVVYNDFEDFDDTGLKLAVTYEDGSSETITSGWTVLNGKALRVNMSGATDSSTATAYVQVEFRGLVTEVPITVNQVTHTIDSSDLALTIPAPKAGESAEPLTIETEKYNATVTWLKAGETFTGTFEEDTFYRAQVSVKAKYVTGDVWYVFEQSSKLTAEGTLEILYKSVKRVSDDNNELTSMSAQLTFPATGERTSELDEKALHIYYEGDENAASSVDALLDRTLTVSNGSESVSYTLRELEKLALSGEGITESYCKYDGSRRTVTKFTGISLYKLCADSGLFPSNLSDSSVVTIGDSQFTWGQIRATGSSYDVEGILTATELPAIIAFGANSSPFNAVTGPMQASRPMSSETDENASTFAVKLGNITLTEPVYLTTHKLTFNVTTEDGANVSDRLITAVYDSYGNEVKPADGVYMLNEGQKYSYSIGAKGYGTQKGTTDVIVGDTVIDINLVSCWDGETLTEPEIGDDGYYLIYTAEELMWFNQNGTGSENVRLMADIMLNSDGEYVNEWSTMNYSETNTGYFAGTFDGNGHTIYNLYIKLENLYTIELAYDGSPMLISSRKDNAAMFGYLSGTVKDLGITGRFDILDRPDSSLASWMQIGGIAGYVTGNALISGCYTDIDIVYDVGKETTVTGGYPDCGYPEYCDTYIGGIAGSVSKGTIENCYTLGTLTASGTRKVTVGGIVGGLRSENAVVQKCYSASNITAIPSELSTSDMISGVGGIVGDTAAYSGGNGGTVEYCFALGDSIDCGGSTKSSANRVVGIAVESAVTKYNFGNISMNVNAGTHDTVDFSRSGVNGSNIDLARAKASLTPYTNIGWSRDIWKSDDEQTLPNFLWQSAAGASVTYSVTVVADDGVTVSFTGGVSGEEGTYTTTSKSTISFTVDPGEGRTISSVTVTGGKQSSSGGHYTVSYITGDVVITVITAKEAPSGDINGDGVVNSSDALLILSYCSGTASLTEAQLACGDVNGDGVVNSSDALAILSNIAGA